MRVSFVPLSVREFDILLNDETTTLPKGRGVSDITVYTPKSIRGGSIFHVLSGLVKSAAPLLMRTVVPEGLNFAKNVIGDINSGEKWRKTLKRRGFESLKELGKRMMKGGRKRKRIRKKVSKQPLKRKACKKDRYKDVFSRI